MKLMLGLLVLLLSLLLLLLLFLLRSKKLLVQCTKRTIIKTRNISRTCIAHHTRVRKSAGGARALEAPEEMIRRQQVEEMEE